MTLVNNITVVPTVSYAYFLNLGEFEGEDSSNSKLFKTFVDKKTGSGKDSLNATDNDIMVSHLVRLSQNEF